MYQQYPGQQPMYPQPPYYGQQYSGCVKFLLYALSFLVPLAGIIIAIVFMTRPDPESKGLGRTCLILGIVSIALGCCIGVALGFGPVIMAFIAEFLQSSGY